MSQGALCLAYGWTARRAPWWTSAGAGLAAFLGATLILERVSLSVWPAFGLVGGLLGLMSAIIPAPRATLGATRRPPWDLPVRMLCATVIVLALTAAASLLPRHSLGWTYGCASVSALAVNGLALTVARRTVMPSTTEGGLERGRRRRAP